MSYQAVEAVLQHSRSKGSARLVLLAIAWKADKEGKNSYPSIQTIMSHANVTEKSVYNALHQLIELGELVLSRKMLVATKDNPYTISFEGAVEVQEIVNFTTLEEDKSVNITTSSEGEIVNFTGKIVNPTTKIVNFTTPLIGVKSPLTVPEKSLEQHAGAHTRGQPSGDSNSGGGNLRSLLANGSSGRKAVMAALVDAACALLDTPMLSRAQREEYIEKFFDRYGQDVRLTEELITYAKKEAASAERGKRLKLWEAIMRKRLDDTSWVSVEEEARHREEGRANGYGNGNGKHNGGGGTRDTGTNGANGKHHPAGGANGKAGGVGAGLSEDPDAKYYQAPPGFKVPVRPAAKPT
jgi:DNA-binding PadR family transcriptional regulator